MFFAHLFVSLHHRLTAHLWAVGGHYKRLFPYLPNIFIRYLQISFLFFCRFKKSLYICSRPSQSPCGKAGQDIDGIQRLTMPFVGQANGKGRFRTLLSASSNFANLNPSAGVMQRSVCVGVLYPNDSWILLYIRFNVELYL